MEVQANVKAHQSTASTVLPSTACTCTPPLPILVLLRLCTCADMMKSSGVATDESATTSANYDGGGGVCILVLMYT